MKQLAGIAWLPGFFISAIPLLAIDNGWWKVGDGWSVYILAIAAFISFMLGMLVGEER